MAATLKDVATLAGVSIKTVSNVVNEYPYVSSSTRERVQTAVESLGYRPNLPARRLRQAHVGVGVLALAIPDLANTYFSDIGNAVIAAAAAHSYTVLLDHTNGLRANEAVVANGLRPHLIDGVILNPLALTRDDLRPQHVGVPLVLLGERLFGAPWDHVVIDNVAAAEVATEHLITLGRRRIAVIGLQTADYGSGQLRLRGYTQALARAELEAHPELAMEALTYHRKEGAEAMHRLLAVRPLPDALFCFNDLLALGAMRVLHERGVRIPDDIAVVGFDDIEECLFATPSLTTIAPHKKQIADMAVSLLLQRIDGSRTGPPERVQPPFQLCVRESTGGVSARSKTSFESADEQVRRPHRQTPPAG